MIPHVPAQSSVRLHDHRGRGRRDKPLARDRGILGAVIVERDLRVRALGNTAAAALTTEEVLLWWSDVGRCPTCGDLMYHFMGRPFPITSSRGVRPALDRPAPMRPRWPPASSIPEMFVQWGAGVESVLEWITRDCGQHAELAPHALKLFDELLTRLLDARASMQGDKDHAAGSTHNAKNDKGGRG